VSFDSNKFIKVKIMELIDLANPKNLRFTAEFENAMENKSSAIGNSKKAFGDTVMDFAIGSDIGFTDIEIEYAMDLYNGINPWTRSRLGADYDQADSRL
jgi:hypothetical protein